MSRRNRLNTCLLVILLAIVWLTYSLGQQRDVRALEYLPEMIHPVAAESFSATTVLAGGSVEQRPVEGTIARGRLPLHLEPGPEGAARAGVALVNPLAGLEEAELESSSAVFRTYCLLCHGPGGEGDGPVARRGFPAPPSLLATNALNLEDGQLFHIISVGQGNMPGHDSQLDPVDRWRAVLHVRHLQAAAAPTESIQGEGL